MKRFLPLTVAVFAVSVAWTRGADAPTAKAPEERRIPVETTPVEQRVFEQRLVVQGNLEARYTAMVPARIPGTLMKLYVHEGETVQAGKTPLLLTDDLKLHKALELRKLDLAVAQCNVMEKAASLEKDKAALERAEKDYKRQQRLFNEDKIGTLDAVEGAEAEYKKAAAEVKHSDSVVALAREQEHQASAQVDMAQKDLSDATVLAPLNGVVAKRYQDVGEMGGPGQPVFRIENLDVIEVSAFLPARYYGDIHVKQTRIQVGLEGKTIGEFPVYFRSPTIDPKLRVFEVKCLLPKGIPDAVPGAMVKVSVVLRREEGLGVPKNSLVERAGHEVAFVSQDGRAKAIQLETGLEDGGWVLVKGKELVTGLPIVSRGQFLLNDGSLIEVRKPASATPPEVDAEAKVAASANIAEPKSAKEN